MIKAKEFEQYMESSGVVSDPEFGEIADLLILLPIMIEEEYEVRLVGVASMVYTTVDGCQLRLTHQVRTPNTPEGAEFIYYFGQA